MKYELKKLVSGFYQLLDIVMVICMVTMVVLVFTNVVLRMGFNTGIDVAEELPRYAFIWLAFVGGIVGIYRRSHLGVDMLISRLPMLGKKICWGLSQAIMAVCSFYILYGTWLQHDVIRENSSPVMQISMLWVYGISYLTGGVLLLTFILNLFRLFMGVVDEQELMWIRNHDIEQSDEMNERNEGEKA